METIKLLKMVKCKRCGSLDVFGWKGGEMICLKCGCRWWDV